MSGRIPFAHLVSAALALAAALLATPQTANAASIQGTATAAIRSAVTMRSSGGDASQPVMRTVAADLPPPREVLRPCRPNEAGDTARCRIILLELQ